MMQNAYKRDTCIMICDHFIFLTIILYNTNLFLQVI